MYAQVLMPQAAKAINATRYGVLGRLIRWTYEKHRSARREVEVAKRLRATDDMGVALA